MTPNQSPAPHRRPSCGVGRTRSRSAVASLLAGWQRTATDSTAALQALGAVGLTNYLSSSARNAPLVLRMDNLSARPLG